MAGQSISLFDPGNDDQHLLCGPVTITIGEKKQLTITVEAGTSAGSADKPNEDAFAARRFGAKCAFAVFDGATSLKRIPAHDTIGMSGARFASHFLRDGFLSAGNWSDDLVLRLNNRLRSAVCQFEGLDSKDVTTVPTSTATLAVVDPDRDLVAIQNIGDSFVLARLTNGNTVCLTKDPIAGFEEQLFASTAARARELNISFRQARDLPETHLALISGLQDQFNKLDCTGFGVINGDPAVSRYLERSSIKISEIDMLVFGSDGLPAPQYPISTAEGRKHLFDNLAASGIRGAFEAKKALEDSDPEWKFARFKHSDDATCIVVKVVR